MKDQEIIEETIRNRGGRLNFSELTDELKNSFEYVKSRAEESIKIIVDQLPGVNKISFDIISDYSFNAFAFGINKDYFIGINRGTISILSMIFDRLLADREVFEFIGDVNKEELNLPLIENLSINFEFITNLLPLFSPPQCPIRFTFSKHMTRLAIDLILAHEIGHIIRGHLSLNKVKKKAIPFDELSLLNENEVDKKMIRKTLEMDADTWAVTMLITSEINRITRKNPLPGQEWTDFYNRPGMVLMLFSFVVTIVFKIFGDNRLDNMTFENDTYPKPRLRCFISMLAIKNNPAFQELNLKMNFDFDKFGIPIHASAALNMVESAFEKITGKKSENLSIDEAWGGVGISQINRLVEFWNEQMMNELNVHSYLRLCKKEEIN